MNLHIPPLPKAFLDRVRVDGMDDQGQPVQRITARGGEPCRDVLRRAEPGESLLLASFCPFESAGPFREFGPVYVLAEPSDEAVRRDALPLDDGSGERYFREQFVLRAYDANGAIADATFATAETAQPTLDRFFGRESVAFVDARFPTYGCWACRIHRA